MMVALLLYSYCEGERSSRRIERRCREDIAYRVLSANQQPDHASLCRFRRRHEQALAGLFVEVLRLCPEAELVRAGLVALDGAKLRGRAQRLAAREQQRHDAYEVRLRERAQKDPRGRLPTRPQPDPDARVNLTDPDSRVVRDY